MFVVTQISDRYRTTSHCLCCCCWTCRICGIGRHLAVNRRNGSRSRSKKDTTDQTWGSFPPTQYVGRKDLVALKKKKKSKSNTSSFLGETDRSSSAKVKLDWKTQFAGDAQAVVARASGLRGSVSFPRASAATATINTVQEHAACERRSGHRRGGSRFVQRVGFAYEHRVTVLFRTLCGNTFYRHVTAVTHAIHAAGPDTTFT